jgi:hypothetical protein
VKNWERKNTLLLLGEADEWSHQQLKFIISVLASEGFLEEARTNFRKLLT